MAKRKVEMCDGRGVNRPDTMTGRQVYRSAPKNIIICLDGTGNQFGQELSNVVKLFRTLERVPGEQVAYYDPGVGTMGDPMYRTFVARKINKVLGLAFGRGLTKNLTEAYQYLMACYEDGDRVFLFGFSRGAYTARALAAFIRQCGLFEGGAENLIPYALKLFLKQTPTVDDFKALSGFRSTYGRQFKKEDDPKSSARTVREGGNPYHWQLRIHFHGLFDTVKSYGWVRNPVTLPGESKNPSVLHVRHALALDERRIFFRQLHWISSPDQDCKEVWFPGVHSDVGGGYPEKESGLAKVALEWMMHEACALGLKVDPYRYGRTLGKSWNERGEWEKGENEDYPAPDVTGPAHESLTGAWRAVQLLPKALEAWEVCKGRRTLTREEDRSAPVTPGQKASARGRNPLLVHSSVLERMNRGEVETITTPNSIEGRVKGPYQPKNLLESVAGDIRRTPGDHIEHTKPGPSQVVRSGAAAWVG